MGKKPEPLLAAAEWAPAQVVEEILLAKEVSNIKADIIKHGFQPIQEHFAAMAVGAEEQEHIPADLVATQLRTVYNPNSLGLVVTEFLEPALLRKEMNLSDTRAQPITRNGGQWIVMTRYFADELVKNLKSERSIASHFIPSIQ